MKMQNYFLCATMTRPLDGNRKNIGVGIGGAGIQCVAISKKAKGDW